MIPPDQTVGVFTTDAGLIIDSWDDWLVRATGIPASIAIGQPLTKLFPDLEPRGMLARFQRVLTEGVVEVLAPIFHHYLLACPPRTPSRYFDRMQQRVTIAPLRENDPIVGTIVSIEDVTARLDHERTLSEQMASGDEKVRLKAARSLAEQDALESATPLLGALGDESWRVRRQAVDGLLRHGGQTAVKSLLRVMREQHRNLSVLNSALQVFTLSGVDAIEPLTECLTDSDADLRIYAAHALGDQHDPRAIPALIKALDDSDSNVRYHTIEALGRLRATDAVDPLLKVAESGDFYLAFPALDALTRIGDSRIGPSIVPLLEDEMLRVPAAEALGQLGDEDAIAPLIGLLNRPGAPALAISQALAALYDRYERLYQEGSYIADIVRSSVTAIGAQNLLGSLNDAKDDGLRALALVLGWMEGEATERALTRLLGRATARKEVVEALVRFGPRVTRLLVEQLDSEDLETRQSAVIALGRIGDGQAVPALVRVMTADDELVIAAAGALAKIGDRRAFEALIALIGHPQTAVRQAVVSAINSIGHPETPARVARLLDDPDPLVRESAVKIAGYFGYPECVESLFERCRDEVESVRRAAIEHIPYLDDPRTPSIVADALENGTAKVRASAAQAFGQLEGPRTLSSLLAAVADPDPWVRYFSARSIGRLGLPDGVPALERLAQTDPANHVRIAAVESLARIGGARVVAFLAPFVESNDNDLARAAIAGLGLIGHPDALPPLLAALRSPDPARRVDALRAVGERGGPGAVDALRWVAGADAEPQVVQSAIRALSRLATPEAVETLITLTSDPIRREACVTALSQLGKEQIQLIGQGLRHAQPAVRRAVVEVLGRMKQQEASGLLSTALQDNDASVRLAAVNALAHLGSRSAERQLVTMARTDPEPAVRRAAKKALRR
jgi:HEAT repeat protein